MGFVDYDIEMAPSDGIGRNKSAFVESSQPKSPGFLE
jgi:hypothetical protein